MKLLIDDVWPSNLKNWSYVEEIMRQHPTLNIVAFVVANYKEEEPVMSSKIFQEWYNQNKDRMTVGVHGYDHGPPPEQERDNAADLVSLATEMLKPYLPALYVYRSPGFQRTIHTEQICKDNRFAGIAYQRRIKYFDGTFDNEIVNCHLTIDKCVNPINRWKDWLNI